MYCGDKLYARMTTTVPINILPGGQGHEHRIDCNVASQGSLFVRGESLFHENNVEWTANNTETVRENALTREDDEDCQSHSHLHADDVVEIVDVRICETVVCGMLSVGGWIPMGVITETSQKDDSSIPNFLHYDDTHIANAVSVDLGQTRLEFLPYCQVLRTNTAAVDRVTERIMKISTGPRSTSGGRRLPSAFVAESAVSSRRTNG